MKTQKIKKYSRLVLVILLLISLSSCFRGRGGERIQNKISEKLDLNTKQQASLKSAIAEYKDLWKKSKDIADEIKDSISAEVQKDTFDGETLATNLQNQINKLNTLVPEYIGIFSDFHTQLTPKQKKELAELVKKYDEERAHHYKEGHRKADHRKKDYYKKGKDKNKY